MQVVNVKLNMIIIHKKQGSSVMANVKKGAPIIGLKLSPYFAVGVATITKHTSTADTSRD